MLAALRGVSFGHFNRNERFIAHVTEQVNSGPPLTARQMWWLTSLVVRHRRQVKDQSAVALAQAWLRSNAEPVVSASADERAVAGCQAADAATAQPDNRQPTTDNQPQLF